jgi:protease IV
MEDTPDRGNAAGDNAPGDAQSAHTPPVMGSVASGPPHMMPNYYGYPPPPRSRWRWVLWMLLLGLPALVIMFSILSVASSLSPQNDLIESRYNRERWKGTDKIAIIHVEGALYETEGGFIKKQIDRVRQDDKVKGIVIRVDSPGGTVSASDFILHHLKELRHSRDDNPIPLVVSMGSIAASGGYYVAMAVEDQENSIFVEPTTWTGSIGVIIPHYSIAGWVDGKISEESIKSHDLKGMGSIFKPLSDEEKVIFQGLVNDAFDRFKEVVLSGRPKLQQPAAGDASEQLEKVATGQIFTARQALDFGLADKEGFLEDAIERCLELAQLEEKDVRVVYFKQQGRLFDGLLMEGGGPAIDAKMLSDLATPRAMYLCTWLPGLGK